MFMLGVQRANSSNFNTIKFLDRTYPHPSEPPVS